MVVGYFLRSYLLILKGLPDVECLRGFRTWLTLLPRPQLMILEV